MKDRVRWLYSHDNTVAQSRAFDEGKVRCVCGFIYNTGPVAKRAIC